MIEEEDIKYAIGLLKELAMRVEGTKWQVVYLIDVEAALRASRAYADIVSRDAGAHSDS